MKRTPPLSREALLKALIDCGRQFYDRRWMVGTAGNLSVKLSHTPLEIAITPSGLSKGQMTLKDLMIIKSQKPGKLTPHPYSLSPSKGERVGVRGSPPLMPSAETVIHQTIHETLPGCGAVFHVHPVYATLISNLHGNSKQRQMLQFEWLEMMKGVGVNEGEIAELAIFPNWQDVSIVARDIRQFLLETPKALPVVLIYNHGLTGWGRTPEQARNHLEIIEFVCEYLYLKRLLSTSSPRS
ncbi:MAG: methylthioribulose-1-phosphate dehydratase [Elusimicrobia bacterium RIFCSPLOWO2_01_FULL_59_12]|nr:MAG: methylthioribulose-1-phosphate dehydratase [Elusimicrobia bacterium RIFCSPLOWO2_01_FULL_59_12]